MLVLCALAPQIAAASISACAGNAEQQVPARFCKVAMLTRQLFPESTEAAQKVPSTCNRMSAILLLSPILRQSESSSNGSVGGMPLQHPIHGLLQRRLQLLAWQARVGSTLELPPASLHC